ncbi:unnamed protein product [Musa textilis]
MSSGSFSKVAVIGSGISGAVCASILAAGGVSVTVFETGRGAGGRMSQRRETTEDGRVLFFDHGAPYFSVSDKEVMGVVRSWEARGLVSEWQVPFGSFDQSTGKYVDFDKDETTKKYVGVPGMNSICKALCSDPGVEAKYGITVGKVDWLCDRNLWSLISLDGQDLGQFDSVVASDKNVVSTRFTGVTGRPPPLDITSSPDLAILSQDIPVRSCFALMLAFSEPLSSIPLKGVSFKNSQVLSWAYCDSSKPGRSHASSNCECWVLHSTAEYAQGVIARTGLKKLSSDALSKVAEELLHEFEAMGINIPHPFFMKAHRWGSAFPAIAIGGDGKCLWDKNKRLAICGDFCASPNVEGFKMGLKLQSLRNFDAFPRAEEHLLQKTRSGAVVSIIGLIIMATLFVHELKYYLTTYTVHQMSVDVKRGETLPIHINMTFPSLPCEVLSVDAIDMSGKHEVDLHTNIWKLRLTREGHITGTEYLSDLVEKEHSAHKHGDSNDHHEDPTKNKNEHGLGSDAETMIKNVKNAMENGEGCQVFGVLDVQRVAGNFHVSVHGLNIFVAQQIFDGAKNVNVSHVIHDLSFGPKYPGIHNPLDGTTRILHDTSGTFKYYIKIVPTEYRDLSHRVMPTNQFSVTEYFVPIRAIDRSWPAVYFLYDLSPIIVTIKEERRSFLHFITRLCAVLGGTFALTGMLDRWMYRIIEAFTKSKTGSILR